MARFNNTELTEQTMQETRQFFADNKDACIAEVLSGAVKVNNNESYFKWMLEMKAEALCGGQDHIFTFLQRAYYIQTGECIALLA